MTFWLPAKRSQDGYRELIERRRMSTKRPGPLSPRNHRDLDPSTEVFMLSPDLCRWYRLCKSATTFACAAATSVVSSGSLARLYSCQSVACVGSVLP